MSRKCVDWQEELLALIDSGAGEQTWPAGIQEHLHACPTCREWLAIAHQSQQALHCWMAPEADPQSTARFLAKLEVHVSQQTHKKPVNRSWVPRLSWAMAVVFIVGATGFFWQSRHLATQQAKQAVVRRAPVTNHTRNTGNISDAVPENKPLLTNAAIPVATRQPKSRTINNVKATGSQPRHRITRKPPSPSPTPVVPDATTVTVALLNETPTVTETVPVSSDTTPSLTDLTITGNNQPENISPPEPEHALLVAWSETY